ncbi:MAG: 50S ribosomal protein L11 methyltransferase [Thermodesulfobacteriota bacterium]
MSKLVKLSVIVTEESKSLLSDFLLGLDAFSVAEDLLDNGKVEISGYFSQAIDINHVVERLEAYAGFLDSIMRGISVDNMIVAEFDRSSWDLWKAELKKVRVSDRIVIRPPWEKYSPTGSEIVIEINPALAFGTGHHESTRLCIGFIERLLENADSKRVLDAGCGSGILSIVAAKLGAKRVVAFDIDKVAVEETKKNLRRNSISDAVNLVCGYIDSIKGKYDLIVANISVEELLHMRDRLKSRLSEEGLLILSGIPFLRRDELLSGIEASALVLREELRDGDWIAMVFGVD